MHKSERLNDMMRYLAGKNHFNLRDLMEKYGISRSSALRDVRALEELGMPIFSRPGRGGSYGILPNRLLAPIVFTADEMYALYVAMRTLDAYQTTPFHLDIARLREKFEGCLAPVHIERLHRVAEILHLDAVQHPNESACLKDLLQFAMEEQPCTIAYRKGTLRTYTLQFFQISAAYGQWYGTAYNFETGRVQVFRCDRIVSVRPSAEEGRALSDLVRSAEDLCRSADAVSFAVRVTERGRDLFHKEHYPSMHLTERDGQCCICGFYNPGEETFIADYFIRCGDAALEIRPQVLRDVIRVRLRALTAHYERVGADMPQSEIF